MFDDGHKVLVSLADGDHGRPRSPASTIYISSSISGLSRAGGCIKHGSLATEVYLRIGFVTAPPKSGASYVNPKYRSHEAR